jgi:hypothetical protein
MAELHSGLFNRSSSLTMIARRTGSNQVFPRVDSPQTAWNYVIYSQVDAPSPAVLAGVFISAEDFALI